MDLEEHTSEFYQGKESKLRKANQHIVDTEDFRITVFFLPIRRAHIKYFMH